MRQQTVTFHWAKNHASKETPLLVSCHEHAATSITSLCIFHYQVCWFPVLIEQKVPRVSMKVATEIDTFLY